MLDGLQVGQACFGQVRGQTPDVAAQALAGAFRLFGKWIARPRASRPASLIPSLSVGCAVIPSATVSTVASASSATVLVGGDALAPVELHADLLQPEVLDGRPAAGGHEHQIGLGRLAAVVDDERAARVLDPVGGGLEAERDAALLELLGQLLRRVR